MEIRKYHGRRTDGGLTEVGAKDTCVSKKTFRNIYYTILLPKGGIIPP